MLFRMLLISPKREHEVCQNSFVSNMEVHYACV